MAQNGEATPFSTLQYAYSWLQPHLSPTMDTILGGMIKLLASLPSSVSNFIPLVIGGLLAYWAVLAAFSALKSTLRQTWFFAKWGTIAAVVAYGYAMVTGKEPMNTSGLTGHFQPGGAGIQGFVNQAASYAGITNPVGSNTHGYGSSSGSSVPEWLARRAYNNLVPAPLRFVANNVLGVPTEVKEGRPNSRRSTRGSNPVQEELGDQFAKTANVATEWLGGFVKQVMGDVLDGGNNNNKKTSGDRWTDQRKRNR